MVGIAYDIHRLVTGEYLILGGVHIESEFKTIAHSDGDVLLHAIIDALLGAASLGDIGEHFPDTDLQYKNINSQELLLATKKILDENKLKIINIDATIILEKPNLKKYKLIIKENIAKLLNLQANQVSIKATTNEKLGSIGASEAIATLATCQLSDF